MMRRLSVVIAIALLLGTHPAFADLSSLLQSAGIGKKMSINDTPAASGLKEALRVGIDKSVKALGRQDGYLKNDLVKIQMPDRLKQAEGLLRKTGFGPQMDELVLSMNRSAEKAAPQARDVFIESTAAMSIEDAQGILRGGNTDATDYFKKSSSARLLELFKPAVQKTMGEYGVTAKYQAVTKKFKSLPLASQIPLPDIESYVAQKALDGLFATIGREETAIRQDPAARVTPLLKQVFA